MKKFCIFVAVFLFVGGLFSANAADMIILKDGNVIEAKIMEMHPNEIRYKRADNLNGPMVFLPKSGVLSIRYENGIVEVINASPSAASPPAGQGSGQTTGAVSYSDQQLGTPTPLQNILNTLPAIRVAGNNLKFQFGGDNWKATLNGDNFWAGTIKLEETGGGSILSLKQTHIWPGAAGKTAGKLAGKLAGGAVGSALDTAGNIAGNAGPVEVSGPVIVLEYKAGPPAKLSYLKSTTVTAATKPANSKYEVIHKKMDFANAKRAAEKRGGYLAVINDAEEQEAIANMLTDPKMLYWIGGIRERSDYKWINDEPMNYTNWAPGEPSSWGLYNNPNRMALSYGGNWHASNNDARHFYIIEWD